MRADGLTLVALAAWTAIPLVLQLVYVLRHGGTFTGVQTTFAPDSFQYLAWIRDAGSHGLIGDNFQLGPSQYVFLQPMLLLSGALWRLGLSLMLAYLLPWAPVAVGLTFVAFRAYARRHLPEGPQASVALILALFFFPPVAVLAVHLGHWWGGISQLPVDVTNSFGLWGYFPRAISVALLALSLLRLERVVAPRGTVQPTPAPRLLIGLAAMALTISWLHPWQGAELVIIIAGLALWTRPSRSSLLSLTVPAIGAALPILYYAALDHFVGLWRVSEAQAAASTLRFSPITLAVGMLPLGLLALLAIPRQLPTAPHRRILLPIRLAG